MPYIPEPISRKEQYMSYLTGNTDYYPKDPITREEQYLYYLCVNGGIGGNVTPEQIQQAVDAYLEENPVQPGATVEQAAQIEKNKTDISELSEDIEKIAIISDNLYDVKKTNDNIVISKDGVSSSNGGYTTSDYIDVTGKDKKYISCNKGGCIATYYDSKKSYISGVENLQVFNNRQIPTGVHYVVVSFAKKYKEDFMLVITDEKLESDPEFVPYGVRIREEVVIPEDIRKPIDERLFVGELYTNSGTPTGDQTISIGKDSCRDEKCGMIAIGTQAGMNTKSTDESDNGHYSVAIGHRAMKNNTTGDHNTAIGWNAMADNSTGDGNTAIGEDALLHNIEGNGNTCVGNRAYQMGKGSNNTVIGANSMYSSVSGQNIPTGNQNVAVGAEAGLVNGLGSGNTSVGAYAKISDDINYAIAIGRGAKAKKERQCVLGTYDVRIMSPLQTILNGDIIVCGTDGIFRKIIFNEDKTVTWEEVSLEDISPNTES